MALILGHEMSHAGLHHVKKNAFNNMAGSIVDVALRMAAGPVGSIVVGAINPSQRLFFHMTAQDFEREADYVAAYLLARAGYDGIHITDMWGRLASEFPEFIQQSYWNSHPATPERMLALRATMEEVRRKKREGKPLMPDMKESQHAKH